MRTALVGRDRELGVLLGCLDEAQQGRANLVVCVGEPGIGKTRLVEELTGQARDRGVLTAWGRTASTDGAPPYWPWREVLRALETAGLARQGTLADVAASGVEPSLEERVRRFDEVARLVLGAARSRPLLVVLDDWTARTKRRSCWCSTSHARHATTVSWSSSAAATRPAPSPPWPRSPTPPRSSYVAWSEPPSASRSPASSGERPATPSWLRCTTPRRATRSSWASSPASSPTGPRSRGPCPGLCSTRSASGSGSFPPTARRRCVQRRCWGPGSRSPSSRR